MTTAIAITPSISLPRLSAYLEQLPAGLDSYPGCLQQASVFRAFVAFLPTEDVAEHVPEPLGALLRGEFAANDWLSEVHATAVYLACADFNVLLDVDFVAKTAAANKALFADPLYKMLMSSARPEVMVKGSASRWGIFHRGITLSTRLKEKPCEAEFTLDFPPFIMPTLISLSYCTAFEAAFRSAGATDVWVNLVSRSPTQNTYACSWRE
ncbi:MAG: hypothetical protein K1X64_15610 [Myxococcaceae bacterium]|nr:hypothetical protein [Myxococcaceae bacterium]